MRSAVKRIVTKAATASRAYTANAVDFDGSADGLTRASDLSGDADSSQGILSVWLRLDGGNGSNGTIVKNTASFVSIIKSSANKFDFDFYDAAGADRFNFRSVATYTAGAAWRHLLASWDTNFTAGNKVAHLYVNDVSDATVASDVAAAFNIDYTRTTWGVAMHPAGGTFFNGCQADLFFAPGQFLDFSVTANRRKFIDANGFPVSLGATGSTPTGVQPLVFLPNPAATVNVNAGSGGNFTINGAPAAASTSP